MNRDAGRRLEASTVSRDHTTGKRHELQKASQAQPGAAFNLKSSHLYFAMATSTQLYALTLSSASSALTL